MKLNCVVSMLQLNCVVSRLKLNCVVSMLKLNCVVSMLKLGGGVLKYGCVLLLGLFAGHRSKFVGVVCEYVC